MPPTNFSTQSFLLLLPPINLPATFAEVKEAYHTPLLNTLRSVPPSKKVSDRRVLDIALPCAHLHESSNKTRSELYELTQSIVAKLYKLIVIVAAKERINVEDTEGIDARVILLAYPASGNTSSSAGSKSREGPIVDIETLAASGRSWNTVFTVENEQGEQLLDHFKPLHKSGAEYSKVKGGDNQTRDTSSSGVQFPKHNIHRYHHAAVGGTFDHLHIGHKLLLTMTVFPVDPPEGKEERAVTVGITAKDLLANKKYAEFLEDWHGRYLSVHNFLHGILFFESSAEANVEITEVRDPGPNGHAMLVKYPSDLTIHYVEIWDPFGPTITVEGIDALVISAETRSGGKAVNQKRKEKGWKELEVFEVDVLDAEEEDTTSKDKANAEGVQETFQNKLSSTEIRKMQAERAKERSKV